jgi:hypothetical protein
VPAAWTSEPSAAGLLQADLAAVLTAERSRFDIFFDFFEQLSGAETSRNWQSPSQDLAAWSFSEQFRQF